MQRPHGDRRTIDLLLSGIGTVLTVVLLVAAGLLYWGYRFADSNVSSQLDQQQIFFPPAGSDALAPKEIGPYLDRYAGQQLTSGEQAKAYADHFIAVHLEEVAGGKTYAQVSAAAQADPTDATLQRQADTLFRGETLRGLLLNAYAFWKIGQLARIAAVAALVGGVVLAALSAAGWWHLLRRRPAR